MNVFLSATVTGRLSKEVCTFILGQILPLPTQLQPIESICLDFRGYRTPSANTEENNSISSKISRQHEQETITKKKKKEKKDGT